MHQIKKLKLFSSRLAVVCAQSIETRCLSWEWRCSWSSADRRCSNYIWVINNFIAYYGAPYIRGLTVFEWKHLNFDRISKEYSSMGLHLWYHYQVKNGLVLERWKNNIETHNNSDITWASWHLKSLIVCSTTCCWQQRIVLLALWASNHGIPQT